MRKLIVNEKYNNKKLSVFLLDNFNGLSMNTLYKALRKKDILINGTRIKENINVHTSDEITVYVSDDYLFKKFNIDIVYKDDYIVAVNKPSGIEVVSSDLSVQTLTTILKSKLGSFISPCHRLDRNTSGIVLFAKSQDALDILLDKFKNKEISKFYKCTVYGIPAKPKSTLTAYLFKDNKKSSVYIYDEPRKGTVEIVTSYKVLSSDKSSNSSTLEVELHTGKTHQIRAHLAHIGHPIIGDGKYGKNEINKKFGKTTQELYAYKIIFNFKADAGILNYLSGKVIEI